MNRHATTTAENPPSRVRYQVLAVACCLALLTYINRLAFGVAASEIKDDLGLNDEQMGYLASSFLVAYGLFQLPGGFLADRLGGRTLLTALVTGWSLLSGATALGLIFQAGTGAAFVFLLVLRSHSACCKPPSSRASRQVMADWMPVGERHGHGNDLDVQPSGRSGSSISIYWHALAVRHLDHAVLGHGRPRAGVVCRAFGLGFATSRPPNPASMAPTGADRRGANRLIAQARAASATEPVGLAQHVGRSLMYGFVGFGGNFFTNMMPLYLRSDRQLSGWAFICVSAMPLACPEIRILLPGRLFRTS